MIPVEWMPPLMFGGLIAFMLIGFPVSFSLMAAGLFFALIAMSQNFFDMVFLQAIPQRIFGSVLANDLLLAIPFFTKWCVITKALWALKGATLQMGR